MYSGVVWNMAKPPGCVVLTMICFFGGVHAAGAEFYYNLKATDTPQIITSPGYPLKYAPNVSYTWHIRAADPSQVVVLETLDSMVHISYDCRSDTVAVFKGANSQTARRVRKWCGNLRYYFDDSSSYFLYFRTDSKFENRGFQVRYYQGPSSGPCNRDFVAKRHAQDIISPGYPVGYFRDMSCIYSIQAQHSTDRIQIDVLDMHIENSVRCQNDNITIVDPNIGEHNVSTICGQMTPSYLSSGPSLQIRFKSNRVKQTKGFKIEYKSILNSDCRDDKLTATDVDSYLVSPGYPRHYYSNLACRWTISSNDPQRTIEVEVMQVEISGTPPACNEDKLEVDYLHWSLPKDVICGSSIPTQKFVSMGNTMLITFTSDSANEGQGFDVRYRLVQVKSTYSPCNQTLVATGTEQVLTSPGYPQISLLTQSCIFTIRAQSGYHIRLTLIDLDIEYSPACKYDSLTISDGTLTLDELWCGKRAGEVVNSQRNEVTVIYGIDDSNNGQGFSLKYSEVRGSASRVQEMVMPVRNTPLYLTSPGFEKRFPQGITYSYIFTADPRQRIRLRVQESYLRYNTADGSCLSERVRLYDGPSSTSSELKSINTGEYGWCALDLPVFISSSNYMTMVFKTVNSFDHGRIGFVLMYEQGNFSDPLPCGESLTASLGKSYLMKKIQPHTSCTWVLTRETNNTYIQLNVLRYDVGKRNDDKCGADHVEIYDGDTEASSRIALLCGPKSGATYIGTGGQMMIKLVTGESPVAFHIEYSSSHEDRCTPKNRRATEQPDYLVSPSYANKYASGLQCTWIIDSGNADYIVKFKVVQASIVSSVDCTYDYLAVYDGMSEATSVQLGKWCWGVDETETIYSTQRYLTVVFHTSKDNTASGFRLRYWRDAALEEQAHEDRCTPKDRRATEQPDYLVSPSYPNKYASGLQCTWLIDSGNADYIVKFKVVQASIVSSVDCTYDYLAVYDGMSEATSVQFGKWCWGVDETETIYSTQRYLTVVFHTSKDNTASGFRLRYWRDAAPEEQGQATATGSNMGTILGGIFGGLIPLAVIIFII